MYIISRSNGETTQIIHECCDSATANELYFYYSDDDNWDYFLEQINNYNEITYDYVKKLKNNQKILDKIIKSM